MIMALALLMQGAPAEPAALPPPTITVVPTIVAPLAPPRANDPAFPLKVKITAGKQVLFEDSLLVDALNGASVTQSRSEAAPESCPNEYRYCGTPTTGLTFRANQRRGGNNALLGVTVNWSRRTQPATCTSYGTRTIMINQTVELAPGKSVRVEGDAGLIVELSR